ncbi:PAS domain-containing protein [Marinovum sp.]|uniref:PAS domain-containing protein n=1 Tax=Marinovum sp. TaxID=2024839 RepID=UPI002B276BFD|nr:PAS domain-containing protein [Marinovum sp.]
MSSHDSKTGVSQAAAPVIGEPADVLPLSDKLRAKWCRPLQQVEAYWDAMRGGRNVPPRSEIDPRGIETALEFAFIAEQVAPTHARLRLGGTHLCNLMGMEVRGMPLSAMIVPVSRERLAHALSQVFEAPARAELSLIAEKRLGKPELTGRLLLLPLMDDFGDVNRALGCFVTDGPVGRAPRRFEVVKSDISALSGRAVQPPRSIVRQPVPGFAEAQSGLVRDKTPYLRVVKSDS